MYRGGRQLHKQGGFLALYSLLSSGVRRGYRGFDFQLLTFVYTRGRCYSTPPLSYAESLEVPRDLDFELKNHGLRLRFLKAYYTNYISDHVERFYDLEPGKQPKFSHCEKKIDSINLHFGSQEGMPSLHPYHTSFPRTLMD